MGRGLEALWRRREGGGERRELGSIAGGKGGVEGGARGKRRGGRGGGGEW